MSPFRVPGMSSFHVPVPRPRNVPVPHPVDFLAPLQVQAEQGQGGIGQRLHGGSHLPGNLVESGVAGNADQDGHRERADLGGQVVLELLAVNGVVDDVPTCIAARHDVIDGAFENWMRSRLGIDRFARDDQGAEVRPHRVATVTEMIRGDDPSEQRFEPRNGVE
jgi:hypothetical protein